MESTTVTQIQGTPEQFIEMLIERIKPLLAPAAKEQEELLTTTEAMQLINIKSREGFKSWCKTNKVFGKPVGKRKMFLKSKVLAAFNR